MEAELKAFAESTEQKLEITVLDPKIRATIHDWARQHGFLARTRYKADELSQMKCRSCWKWFSVNWEAVESDYGDATTPCPHCGETVGWYNDWDYLLASPGQFKFKWKSTGQMLLLKSTHIAYKRKFGARYNYRKHYTH